MNENEGGSLATLVGLATQKYDITIGALRSRSRVKNAVFQRHVFCLAAHLAGYSYAQISRVMSKDHTSVIYAVREARKDEHLRREAYELLEALGNAVIPDKKWALAPNGKYTRIYEKYEGKCAVCSFDEVVEVHHIIPQRVGGTNDPENLILLCPNHHAMADRGMLFMKDTNSPNPLPTCPQP
jgi:5-methylcytosine-specific restriction endonuclease McrA